MPITYFPPLPAGNAAWGQITGSLSNQADIQLALNTKSDAGHSHTGQYEPLDPELQDHLYDTANPHQVTKSQAGLSNVRNALQVCLNEPDILTLSEKLVLNDDDLILVEDSAGSFNKKKVKLSTLKTYLSGVL